MYTHHTGILIHTYVHMCVYVRGERDKKRRTETETERRKRRLWQLVILLQEGEPLPGPKLGSCLTLGPRRHMC